MDAGFADQCGLSVTCKSRKALELYNTVIKLFISQTEEFVSSLKNILELDPDFVLARCLLVTQACLRAGRYALSDEAISSELDILKKSYDTVLEREKRHIDAVIAYRKRDIPKATSLWDDITVYYPQDLHAMRCAFRPYIEIGEFARIRDMLSRAVHYCPKQLSVYPYVLSIYAFSLEENNQRDLAERFCRQSIAIQPKNPWAFHAMCHVMEEERGAEIGIEFLTSHRNDWKDSIISCHIAWHLMLYYLDLNQIDTVLQEFDNILLPNLMPENVQTLLDAASLLWRFNLLGIDPGERRWELVLKPFSLRIGHPDFTWLETHLMMSLAYGKISASAARLALAKKMIKSLEEYGQTTVSSDCKVADMIGVPLCNALLAYGEERYSDVVALLVPLKYDIIKIGGSWAQRQVFSITLIQAAIKAKNYCQAMAIIIELKAQKPHNKSLKRLQDQVLTLIWEDKK